MNNEFAESDAEIEWNVSAYSNNELLQLVTNDYYIGDPRLTKSVIYQLFKPFVLQSSSGNVGASLFYSDAMYRLMKHVSKSTDKFKVPTANNDQYQDKDNYQYDLYRPNAVALDENGFNLNEFDDSDSDSSSSSGSETDPNSPKRKNRKRQKVWGGNKLLDRDNDKNLERRIPEQELYDYIATTAQNNSDVDSDADSNSTFDSENISYSDFDFDSNSIASDDNNQQLNEHSDTQEGFQVQNLHKLHQHQNNNNINGGDGGGDGGNGGDGDGGGDGGDGGDGSADENENENDNRSVSSTSTPPAKRLDLNQSNISTSNLTSIGAMVRSEVDSGILSGAGGADQSNSVANNGAFTVQRKKRTGASDGTYELPVVQGTLNPNLVNTIKVKITLDSKYREYANGLNSNPADYIATLSTPIVNTVNLSLYSYQIPYCWYAFDTTSRLNTCMWIVYNEYDDSTNVTTRFLIPICIPSGNYSPDEMVDALTAGLNAATFETPPNTITYNSQTGRLAFFLDGLVCRGGTMTNPQNATELINIPAFTISAESGNASLLFFNTNPTSSVTSSPYFDQTLGWFLGFREPAAPIAAVGNYPNAILNVNGPKYLMLLLDDFNAHQISQSMVGIAGSDSFVNKPSYITPNMPAVMEAGAANDITAISGATIMANSVQSTASSVPIIQQHRNETGNSLTANQLYAANEISRSKLNNITHRLTAPVNANVFAILPVKTSGVAMGDLIVDFSGSLQDNTRIYFGPVDLNRMHIRLVDDRGVNLNMNGAEWSVTMIAEHLYQY